MPNFEFELPEPTTRDDWEPAPGTWWVDDQGDLCALSDEGNFLWFSTDSGTMFEDKMTELLMESIKEHFDHELPAGTKITITL